MKWATVNLFLLYCTIMVDHSHYVQGAGYQPSDQSSKGVDQADNLSAANYKFEYGVNDETVGQQFSHEEERNGYQTRGRYTVLLPDGRLQIVTYTADENGYKADVKYENEPTKSSSRNGGSNGAGGGGGYGHENVEAAATSYSSPPIMKSVKQSSKSPRFSEGGDGSFGKRTKPKSFVNVRKTIDGRMFNYKY